MENASKALIIAGAILLSILIISLGMVIYQNATSSVSHTDLSEQEIQTFNGKFQSYAGNSVSGTSVNALIDAVTNSNTVNVRDLTGKYITMKYFKSKDNSDATWSTTAGDNGITSTGRVGKVPAGLVYTVQVITSGTTGLVSEINITAN